ncbi:MAG TPA: tRNA-uridine aminocarboxypropyltransferase [Azospirillaceae bacterium]|nr:tRNA-uridine aminocarboxypropyltransferase [Azospirillaceae bacterium]
MTHRFARRIGGPPRRGITPARGRAGEPTHTTGAAVPDGPVMEACARCGKRIDLCVCAALDPVPLRHFVLILQHPQEQDVELGTARIAAAQLPGSVVKVGLSWPNLKAALGREADPRRWGVLYLGPAKAPAGQGTPGSPGLNGGLLALDKQGVPLPDQTTGIAGLEGIILLDGTWSQAKALWWRNPWLLKCRRLVLFPKSRSRYGTLRREPRRESVSTIEAAALALAHLEGDPHLVDRLLKPFDLLLAKLKARPRGPHPLPDGG